MSGAGNSPEHNDPFDLSRFIKAQDGVYDRALGELKRGRKSSHWMWFVFPQIDGLGFSSTTKYYSIKSLQEAREYLDHPILGQRLRECAETILALEGLSASAVFGYPDDLKLKSSMTLFAQVAGPKSVFEQLIQKYFQGSRDERTLQLLERLSS
jgi:uncharacterized protein (DUF1810 family)